MESILDNLNPSQRQAVEYCDGPSLVIAGAGSGKTRVLTFKIAHLINLGLAPWNILALTFTNKAAEEMKSRIAHLVGDEKAHHIHMGTFHSVFSRILRVEAEAIGYESNFTIYDEADSRSLIKSIVKEMGFDDNIYKPAAVHKRISTAKNSLVGAQQYANDPEILERDSQARMPAVGQIYVAYQQRCHNANAMDFDDLLMLTFELFCDYDDIRRRWAERFKFILVDEYQDTNRVQQQIVEQLSRENQRVCVVGDDAQSIYAFRGANIDNILNFNNVYPGSKRFTLEQNYRSTQRIVQAANSLIKHNQRQIEKNVFSENDEGECLLLKKAYSDKEEAAIVCNTIKKIKRQDGAEYSDFAILYRTNAQSRPFEEECLKQGIPYRIFGGLSFYQRKEIKDIVAYFRLVCNPNDEEAFRRVINYPKRGIGDATVQKLVSAAHQKEVSLWSVATNPTRYQLGVSEAVKTKISLFTKLIRSFASRMQTSDAYTLGSYIIRVSGIHADLFSSSEADDISRQENLEEFMAAMQDFVETKREEGREQEATLQNFLQEISLQSDKESNDGHESKISLMTVHAAKGLEFQTVFIVGLEENIFPSQMSLSSLRELEEERRLLYVAITRAEKHCILTYAKNRWRYGKMEFGEPSRFINDIDARLVTSDADDEPFGRTQPSTPSSSFAPWFSGRMQNSRPVAGQFMADAKPKITRRSAPEKQYDPYSPAFRQEMEAARSNPHLSHGARAGGFRQATDLESAAPVIPTGFKKVRQQGISTPLSTPSQSPLQEGMRIEHQRFGIGTVLKIEGTGDNAKATVEFRNLGTKQLLLKFAKYSIID